VAKPILARAVFKEVCAAPERVEFKGLFPFGGGIQPLVVAGEPLAVARSVLAAEIFDGLGRI